MKKYYWSMWVTEKDLISAGADDILPVTYCDTKFVQRIHKQVISQEWDKDSFLFSAEEGFDLFIKVKLDKSAVEIPKIYHTSVEFDGAATIGTDYIKKLCFLCSMDF